MTFWTDERITTLRDALRAGHPPSFIARRMDTTRNAVIGKAWRMGIGRNIMVEQCTRLEREAWHMAGQRMTTASNRLAADIVLRATATRRCGTAGCRNTRQPGRSLCAECARPAARERG